MTAKSRADAQLTKAVAAAQAFQNDPFFRRRAPTLAPTALDDLKPLESTVRMTVHTHSAQRFAPALLKMVGMIISIYAGGMEGNSSGQLQSSLDDNSVAGQDSY